MIGWRIIVKNERRSDQFTQFSRLEHISTPIRRISYVYAQRQHNIHLCVCLTLCLATFRYSETSDTNAHKHTHTQTRAYTHKTHSLSHLLKRFCGRTLGSRRRRQQQRQQRRWCVRSALHLYMYRLSLYFYCYSNCIITHMIQIAQSKKFWQISAISRAMKM